MQSALSPTPVRQARHTWRMSVLQCDEMKGVLNVLHCEAFMPDEEWRALLQILAAHTALAIEHAALLAARERSNHELRLAHEATIEGLVRLLEWRDAETAEHCHRVTRRMVALAQAMGFSAAEIVHLRRGAMLHDLGKLAIPDSILLKPGPLTASEYAVMQQHTVYAYAMLTSIPFLQPARDIPYCHHEKWDGTGYPRGLQGPEIPLSARLFAVIDVYDALCSDRPYRQRWPEDRVRAYLAEQAGQQFDPAVVAAFLTQGA